MALKITDEQNYQDIADAIRSKLGSSDTFLPSEMADAVESIPAGGNTELKTIFIDYDGTVLHEYTQDEVDALTALPALPSHDGLTCQGWNWTLAELQAYEKPAVVGANYITDDGKTRVYITIPVTDKYVKASLSSSSSFRCIIDWGDGSSSEITKSAKSAEHTYSTAGEYAISFEVTEGVPSISGSYNVGSQLISSGQTSGAPYGAIANIHKIELGANITVGSYGMADMKNLKSVSVPEECSFKEDAFARCYSLQAFVFPKRIPECDKYIFLNDYYLKYIALSPSMETITESFASGCNGLERISLPNSITSIDNYAFNYCGSLVELLIPEGIQSIGMDAFSYAGNMTKTVILPSSLTAVGSRAFSNTYFEKLTINGRTGFGNNVFANNTKLKEVEINSVIASWGTNMFMSCSALRKITVADGNVSLGNDFAYKASSLKEVILPDSLTAIPSEAFANCNSLEDINLPSNLSEIGPNAFNYCHLIKSMIIPEGVTTVSSYAFSSMETLDEIVFLGNIEKIERYAFGLTYGLRTIDLSHCTSVPVLDNVNAFVSNSTRLKIKVPVALYDEWIAADKWSTYASKIEAA